MISSLAWVRKGVSQETPSRFVVDDAEFERIQANINMRLADSRADLVEAEAASGAKSSDAKGSKKKAKKGKGGAAAVSKDDEAFMKEFDLENYSDDDGDETGGDEADGMDEDLDAVIAKMEKADKADAALFGDIKGLTYYGSNEEDPDIIKPGQDDPDNEELAEMEELMIAPTDQLILAAKTEDEVSHIEVYVYEEAEDNLFVHHDIMLPSFPLCIEWMNVNLGRNKNGDSGGRAGSYVAVGTFDPEIEIWDLNVVDSMYPEVILGGVGAGDAAAPLGTGKKKRRSKKPTDKYHVDAVMSLSWNRHHPTLIASGSADTTVKLWDITSPNNAVRSFNVHKAKVQAVSWSATDTTVLLTGGYDRRACVFDTRSPDKVNAFSLSADVEVLKWDPFHSERFMVATEDGIVRCFDTRSTNTATPLFTIHAHDGAVSAMDISSLVPDLMVTGSTDKNVKVWSLSASSSSSDTATTPSKNSGSKAAAKQAAAATSASDSGIRCVVTRDLGVGRVFAANLSSDSELLAAVAGNKGGVVIWNLEGSAAVRKAFPGRSNPPLAPPDENDEQEAAAAALKRVRREIATVEDDGEEEEADAEAGAIEALGGGGDDDDDDDDDAAMDEGEDGWDNED